jgi:hypothetical protein
VWLVNVVVLSRSKKSGFGFARGMGGPHYVPV